MKTAKNKLLVCVDKTEHSKVAVRFASAKAKNLKMAVEFLHVIDSSEYNSNTLFGVTDKIRDEKRAEAEKLMTALAQEAQNYAGVTPSCMIREGVIGEVVVKVVKEDSNFNMVIIGKAPQEAKKNDVIAMLTSELASKLMIPMTIVPGNLGDKEIEELV